MSLQIPNQKKIIDHYGTNEQMIVWMEECSELVQAVSKVHRTGLNYVTKDHLVEEIADVLICIEQMKEIYDITDDNINQKIYYKAQRQKERMEQDG